MELDQGQEPIEIRTKFHICCYAHRVASVLVKDLLWSPICHKDTANSCFFMSSLPQSRPHPVVDQSDSVETVKTVIISFN